MPSAHRWWTASPARFEHRVPGFDGVVPQHPPQSLGYRRTGRSPAVGAHRHPLGMNGGCIWLELHHLLLLCAHQPAFSAVLFWWFVGGAVTGQGVGRRQTEDSSAKHLLPRRRPGFTMANSLLERWAISSRTLFRPKDAGESNGTSMNKLLLSSRKRSLSQSKRGLREASGDLGLRPRSNQGRGTFAWVDASIEVLANDVEQIFASPRKNIKFCLCLISKNSKFKALVQKFIGASFFSRIHSGKSRK